MRTIVMIISGNPVTKKNSQRIIRIGNRSKIMPSKAYEAYEAQAIRQLQLGTFIRLIDHPVNVECRYYMATKRRIDLVNLLEATDDILVRAGVLADDNCKIVAGHDGSRVLYDKNYPRVEITIRGIDHEQNETR